MGRSDIPTSREYVHKACGEVTEVSGGEFASVACPVPGVNWTMCSPCGKHFPIGEFHWKDTGESIVAYYSRCRERIPMPTKVISARTTGMVFTLCGAGLGVALGVLAGQWLGILAGIAAGIVGVLVGALGGLVVWGTLHEIAIRSALNVPDVRCLK